MNNLVNLQSPTYKTLIQGRIKWRKEELKEEKNLITLFSSWYEIIILSRLRGCYNIYSNSIIDELYFTKNRRM
jgi:hypothetical protein